MSALLLPAKKRGSYDIGVDLDGVCFDFVSNLRDWLLRQGHCASRLGHATRWEFFEDWGLTLEQFLDSCHAAAAAGHLFRKGRPFPGVVDAIDRLRRAGHRIHIITDRGFGGPGVSEQATCDWLAEHRIGYDSLTFSADKTISPAPDVERCEWFIEDRDKNYHALDAAGVHVWLRDMAYNQHVETERRVPDMPAFADLILAA